MKLIQFKVTEEQAEAISQVAIGLRMSQSELIRYAVCLACEYHQADFPMPEIKAGRRKIIK